jgi:hypothetical protein
MRGIGLVPLALISLAGCGLGDYEKRMDEKREQLRLFDEEATLLGDLIDMPTGKDLYGNEIKVPFDIFLRLPKNVFGTFEGPKAVYQGDKQPLFRFSGKKDLNIFVAWAKLRDKTPDLKSPAKDDEILADEFRARVRKALIDFIAREYSGTVGANVPEFDKLKADPRKAMRDGREQVLSFESIEFADPRVQNPSRFYVFLQTLTYRQAAVIYQVPAAQADQAWLRNADVSLRTLDITVGAGNARTAFRNKK